MYTEHGFPWFDLYDEEKGDISASDTLKDVKSVKDMDEQKGFGTQQDDSSVDVPDQQVKELGKDPSRVEDGKW